MVTSHAVDAPPSRLCPLIPLERLRLKVHRLDSAPRSVWPQSSPGTGWLPGHPCPARGVSRCRQSFVKSRPSSPVVPCFLSACLRRGLWPSAKTWLLEWRSARADTGLKVRARPLRFTFLVLLHRRSQAAAPGGNGCAAVAAGSRPFKPASICGLGGTRGDARRPANPFLPQTVALDPFVQPRVVVAKLRFALRHFRGQSAPDAQAVPDA